MSSPQDSVPQAPSRARYILLCLLCSLAFILYIDRICISQALTDIELDLGITHIAMGYVLAAFTIAYTLFEVPIGLWGDRYGSRGVLARIVIFWSIFTALTGVAWGFFSLITIRFLFGAGEAGAFPNTARILARWFPVESRGSAQGLVNAMSLIGGAFAPMLTAYLIKSIGWRWSFMVFSIPGIIWAGIFYWWYRDNPEEHPSVNDAERRLIAAGTSTSQHQGHQPIPWRIVLTTPQIWLLGGVLMCSAFNTYLYFSWYPTYLKEGRGLEDIARGNLASLVLGGGAIGCICGGLLIDRLVRLTGDRHRCRRLWSSFALFCAAISLLIGKTFDNPFYASLFTAGSVMFTVSTLAAWWGAVTDISGRHLGALFGLMNSIGGLGAIASQLFVGPYVDWMGARGFQGRAAWDSVFFVYAGVLFAGSGIWLMIDSSRGITDHPTAHEAEEPLSV